MARRDAYQVWVETGKLDEVLEFIKECARKLVTQKEMCKYLGISQDSFSRLKRKYPIIAETQLEAKTNLKIDLAGALYKKAIGFEVTEETHHIDDAHGSRPPRRKIVRNIKYIPPETRAIIYLLTQNFGIEYAEKFAEIQMTQKRAKDEKEVWSKDDTDNND